MPLRASEELEEAVALIERSRVAERPDILQASSIDLVVRKDGHERRYEGDFVKHLLRGFPALRAQIDGAL